MKTYGDFSEEAPIGALVLYVAGENNLLGITLVTEQEKIFPRMFDADLNLETLDEALDHGIEKYRSTEELYPHIKNAIPAWKALYSYIINVVLYATMPEAETEFVYYDKSYKKLQQRLQKQKSPKKRTSIQS